MAKIPRIHIEGALLYVTSRGDNDREIFKDKDDYSAYLDLLRKYKEQYGFKLYAYCFLPNHLHLLLELKEGLTVSDIMHDLNANYTKYFNGRYERKGHLFQERYKMIIMEKDTYILKVMAYIHLNPVAQGLVGNLKEYLYSSYRYYIDSPQSAVHGPQIDMEEEIKEVRSRLSELSVVDYAGYMAGIPKGEMENLGRTLTKNTILGSKQFIESIERIAEELSAENKEADDQGARVMHGKFIKVSVGLIVVLGIFSLYLYISSSGLKKNFRQELEQKNVELNNRLKEEKAEVAQDLKERHAADMVSYDAMAKRMELEKAKAAELEEKLERLEGGAAK